jgi:hypothetical protein
VALHETVPSALLPPGLRPLDPAKRLHQSKGPVNGPFCSLVKTMEVTISDLSIVLSMV